nr:NAD(P) transhydrogenase (B-specific) (EC 1.6.1.1) - Rhodospirillum rubrum (fragments) [Rhodospirillum rubrum]
MKIAIAETAGMGEEF